MSSTTKESLTNKDVAGATPPKRFKGDAHAVVAMIFRPLSKPAKSTTAADAATEQEDERLEDVPLPVTILPKEQCEEDAHAEKLAPDPIQFAYDQNYWTKLNHLLSNCEIFYILRSTNLRDRWSGQVGFPGGRKKPNEADVEAAAREVHEEVGLELPFLRLKGDASLTPDESAYTFLGRLNDRVITQNNRKLVVSCLMYFQKTEKTPSLTLAPSEVAACGWLPVRHFTTPQCASGMRINLQSSFLGRKHRVLASLVGILGISSFVFVRVSLPLSEMFVSHSAAQSLSDKERQDIANNFNLWGLTLGLTSEMLMSAKLRERPFELRTPMFLNSLQVDRVFDSKPHNMMLALVSTAIEKIVGHPLTWEQKVTSYMTFVVAGVPFSVTVATAAAYISSKL